MATTTPALLTLEEYLRTTYHPDCDFVDGILEERNVGEEEHGTLQIELGVWFRTHPEWNLRVTAEYRTRVAQTKVRIPDVTVVYRHVAREAVRTTPALICIEILSREDRLPRTAKVMEDYLAMGVPNLWIIDPNERSAYTYTTAGLQKVTTGRIEIPNTPIHLHLPSIFASLD